MDGTGAHWMRNRPFEPYSESLSQKLLVPEANSPNAFESVPALLCGLFLSSLLELHLPNP